MENQLSAALIAKSLNYHGQQLQKIWESERGENDLYKIGVPTPDFAEYQARQKFLNFQDRGKRLKLQQFIAKKANYLFDVDLLQDATTRDKVKADEKDAEKMFAVLPPFELFNNMDKTNRQRHFFEVVNPGDLVMGTVINKSASGMLLKILCTVGQGSSCRYVADINVKAFCSVSNTIPAFDIKKNMTRGYAVNDTVVCEVLEVIPDTDKMSVGMKGTVRHTDDPSAPPLGLIHADDYPNMYKKALDAKGETYHTMLMKCPGFNNPTCVQYLSDILGLGSEHHSNMKGFRKRFPQQEYVNELRQLQASKWAFRSVAEGIEHFKSNRHTEAFGCLNKALSIDPKNVEGLVARGALYANTGSFKKAIEDFETALKLNPSHANARKYMGETLVALGRSYEDEHKYDEARKAYQDCLAIIPYHEEAKNSIEFLKTKNGGVKPLIDAGELLLPNISARHHEEGGAPESRKDGSGKKKKKKGGKAKKRRNNSSSTSSSSTSDSSQSSDSSSDSSDSSGSSSTGSDNEPGKRRKKKHSSSAHSKARGGSLSPLSKRMALMDPQQPHSNTASNILQFNKGNAPGSGDDYEHKVRKFLEMTREDSDYEEKVRKFLEETARFKKQKSSLTDQEVGGGGGVGSVKPKRKKNKKDKSAGKMKKESKRKRKERERKERKALKRGRTFDLREFEQQMESKKFRDALRKELSSHKHGDIFDETTSPSKKRRSRNISTDDDKMFNPMIPKDLDDLDELETKLNAYYAKMEKDTMSKRSGSQMSLHHEDSPPPPHAGRRDHKNSMNRDPYSIEPDSAEGKWKMQFGKDNRFASKPTEPGTKQKLVKSYPFAASESDDEMRSTNSIPLPADGNKTTQRKSSSTKPPPPPPRKMEEMKPPSPKPPKGNVVLDKFGNFRLVEEPQPLPKQDDDRNMDRKSRSRSKPRNYRSGSRSTSRSSRGKRSRSGGSYRKYSRSRSRSRSYNSGSRSRSHSRSRSRSYNSRSRSRSRSYRSNSRNRRYDRRVNHRGRGSWDNRGTYYKPRFNNSFQNQNRGGFRGRGFRDNYDRNYRGRRGGYNNYRNRGMGNRNNRGRFFRGGFRDFRRYDRNSRDRSEDRRSYSDDDERKNRRKMDDRRSEGENEGASTAYIDHKEIEGKWADTKEVSKEEQQNTLDEMSKIIDKIKKDKDVNKEVSKETW